LAARTVLNFFLDKASHFDKLHSHVGRFAMGYRLERWLFILVLLLNVGPGVLLLKHHQAIADSNNFFCDVESISSLWNQTIPGTDEAPAPDVPGGKFLSSATSCSAEIYPHCRHGLIIHWRDHSGGCSFILNGCCRNNC